MEDGKSSSQDAMKQTTCGIIQLTEQKLIKKEVFQLKKTDKVTNIHNNEVDHRVTPLQSHCKSPLSLLKTKQTGRCIHFFAHLPEI